MVYRHLGGQLILYRGLLLDAIPRSQRQRRRFLIIGTAIAGRKCTTVSIRYAEWRFGLGPGHTPECCSEESLHRSTAPPLRYHQALKSSRGTYSEPLHLPSLASVEASRGVGN